MEILVRVILTGIGATVLMDLWAVCLNRAFGVAMPDYGMVGRWLGLMPSLQFFHPSIRSAPPVDHERAIGWIAHYAIGILFAAVLFAVVGGGWFRHPSLIPAIVFGILTVAAPFLLMQPGMGLGVASARAPNPRIARFRSLATHLAFGVGLYVAATALAVLVPSAS